MSKDKIQSSRSGVKSETSNFKPLIHRFLILRKAHLGLVNRQ